MTQTSDPSLNHAMMQPRNYNQNESPSSAQEGMQNKHSCKTKTHNGPRFYKNQLKQKTEQLNTKPEHKTRTIRTSTSSKYYLEIPNRTNLNSPQKSSATTKKDHNLNKFKAKSASNQRRPCIELKCETRRSKLKRNAKIPNQPAPLQIRTKPNKLNRNSQDNRQKANQVKITPYTKLSIKITNHTPRQLLKPNQRKSKITSSQPRTK